MAEKKRTVPEVKKRKAPVKHDTKLYRYIHSHGISQYELTKMIQEKHGIYYPTGRIANMVTGRVKDMRIKTFCVIADVLGCTIDELVDRDYFVKLARLEFKEAGWEQTS